MRHGRSENDFSILNATRGGFPNLPFVAFKNAELPRRFELSLVFIGDARSRSLNRRYRRKDAPANVLAFPLGKTSGEIFINLPRAHREARRFAMTGDQFVAYLFIHGLLHLKGLRHGSTMEKEERKLLTRFGFS